VGHIRPSEGVVDRQLESHRSNAPGILGTAGLATVLILFHLNGGLPEWVVSTGGGVGDGVGEGRTRLSSYCDILHCVYKEHEKGTQQPCDDTLKGCLKDMLRMPRQGPIFIILDALDECPDSSGFPSPRYEVLHSDGKVWFGSVNHYFWPNPEPELGFGSALSLSLSLNCRFGFG
jgi:hypothetical protein